MTECFKNVPDINKGGIVELSSVCGSDYQASL